MNDPLSDSKDDSGQPIATGDVSADLSSSDPAGRVPDRKVRVLCPYCGRPTLLGAKCEQCRGLLDPLSRQATQNSMGPWFLHDPQNPFRPGCSYDVIRDMVRRGRITAQTVLRGPTTRQYWMIAARTPSIANLLGKCHNCQEAVTGTEVACHACGADFSPELDRQFLGLGPVHLLPGQAPPEEIAQSAHRTTHSPAASHARTAHAAHTTAGTATRPTTGDSGVETGEYRALLTRLDRLDRELGTARLLLAIASVAVIVLAGAVLWFSGVFRSTSAQTASETAWPGSQPVPAPAPAEDPDGPPEDEPMDGSMPGEPPPPPATDGPADADPDADADQPETPDEPGRTAAVPTNERQPSPSPAVDPRLAEWALLRGLP
ncbi:MAG: hypothetical protein L6Q35_03070 [Phycisphaerales bacterium]|nr:hypothetical protein [Phycisphaerales bacterium]